jgi:hypothetical protein
MAFLNNPSPVLKPSDIWPRAQLRNHSLCSFVQPHIISPSLTSQYSPQKPGLIVLNHPQSVALLYRDTTDCIRQIIKFSFLTPVLLGSRQEYKVLHKVPSSKCCKMIPITTL